MAEQADADMITKWRTLKEKKEYFRKNYLQRRIKQLELCASLHNKEVQCFKCDSKDNLELDHINREDKAFSINKKMLNINELNKCQILCYNCHKEKTRLERQNNNHGSPRMCKRCSCNICKKAKRELNYKYKQSSKQNKNTLISKSI